MLTLMVQLWGEGFQIRIYWISAHGRAVNLLIISLISSLRYLWTRGQRRAKTEAGSEKNETLSKVKFQSLHLQGAVFMAHCRLMAGQSVFYEMRYLS